MWVLGVTGGIGSGKTTVTNLFAKHGIEVVDADIVARHILDKGTQALAAVRQRYGDQVLQANGSLNRTWLREKIFQQPDEKDWLDALTHPLIREQLLQSLEQARSPYVILSAPLLVENNLTRYCNRVLVVDVSEATQRERTQQRDNVSAAQIERIMQAQASRQQRLAAADDIINNEGDRELLTSQVAKLHSDYLALAQQAEADQRSKS